MNRLSNDDRSRVIACLVEGNSIRATVRMTGAAKKTVARLGVELGRACEKFADRVMVNLPCEKSCRAQTPLPSLDSAPVIAWARHRIT